MSKAVPSSEPASSDNRMKDALTESRQGVRDNPIDNADKTMLAMSNQFVLASDHLVDDATQGAMSEQRVEAKRHQAKK